MAPRDLANRGTSPVRDTILLPRPVKQGQIVHKTASNGTYLKERLSSEGVTPWTMTDRDTSPVRVIIILPRPVKRGQNVHETATKSNLTFDGVFFTLILSTPFHS